MFKNFINAFKVKEIRNNAFYYKDNINNIVLEKQKIIILNIIHLIGIMR